jgi:GTP cyclohydrolase I
MSQPLPPGERKFPEGTNPKYHAVPEEVERLATAWLAEMGFETNDAHRVNTPLRISWYVMNVLRSPKEVHFATFPNEPRVEDMVVLPPTPIWSACSHHLLPFFGVCNFAYIPGERIIGLSKVPELIKEMARGPWVQETLGHCIADKLYELSGAMGVAVRLRCVHTCMMFDLDDGAVQPTTTCALRGVFAYNPDAKAEFLQHIQCSG